MNISSIGIVPDGNRRYAKKYNISYEEAYGRGFEKAKELMRWAFKIPSVKNVTFYALSLENITKRSEFEKKIVFGYFHKFLDDLNSLKEVNDGKIRVKFLGKMELIPKNLADKMVEFMKKTENNGEKTLNFLVAYNGIAEIVYAAKKAAENGEINEKTIEKNLYIPHLIDLVIRTGDVSRLSGFMTWQTTYSELYFLNKLWPEVTEEDFKNAINWYGNIERRFGK